MNQDTPLLRKNWVILLLFIGVAFLFYGNTLSNGYAVDDYLVTDGNPLIAKGLKAIPEIFTTNYINDPDLKVEYRPLVKLTYAIENAIWGFDPALSHLINVLLYGICGFILFLAISALIGSGGAVFALFVSFLFMAHPVHTEVVASLKNRDELLSFFFSISALYAFVSWARQEQAKWLLFGIAFFVLALLSKATAMPFAALIPVSLYFIKDAPLKRVLIAFAALAVITAAFYLTLTMTLPSLERTYLFIEKPLTLNGDLGVKIATAFYTVGYYIKLLLLPHPLRYYYGYAQVPLLNYGDPIVWISMITLLIIAAIGLYGFIKRDLRFYGVVFFLIAISVFSNFIVEYPGVIGERALFTASLGFSWILALGLFYIAGSELNNWRIVQSRQSIFVVAITVINILYWGKTFSRNQDWKDELTLARHDMPYLEASAKANQLYAQYLREYSRLLPNGPQRKELLNESLSRYQKSVEIWDGWSIPYNSIGLIYAMDLQQTELAIPYFKRSCELDTNYLKPHYNLARCYSLLEERDSAAVYYRKTIEIDSTHMGASGQLVIYEYIAGDTTEAYRINDRIKRIYPESEVPYINAGNFALREQDTLRAMKNFELAVERDPANKQLIQILGQYYYNQGDMAKAEYYQLLFGQP